MGQTVHVRAEGDPNAADERAAVRHSIVDGASAAEYRDIVNRTLAVTVRDNDVPPPPPLGPPSPPVPSCGDAVVPAQEYQAGEAIAALVLPATTGGMGPLRYGVGPEMPAGLTYTAPADPTATGGVVTGVPAGAQAATAYTLTATEADGETTALLTFTIRVTAQLSDEAVFAAQPVTAVGRIKDDDTEQARQRSVGMVLAGVGRTLATDAVDVIGDRFVPPPVGATATVGGQALSLRRDGDTARWRRALGVEVGSLLEGGAGEFGRVRGAAWSAFTRHLRTPHAAAAPLSAWDLRRPDRHDFGRPAGRSFVPPSLWEGARGRVLAGTRKPGR